MKWQKDTSIFFLGSIQVAGVLAYVPPRLSRLLFSRRNCLWSGMLPTKNDTKFACSCCDSVQSAFIFVMISVRQINSFEPSI